MKRLFKFAIIVFLALLSTGLQSCERENEKEEVLETIDYTDYISIIKDMGFDTESIVEHKEYFVVEGDIRLDKTNLITTTRQARASALVYGLNRFNIKVKIDPSVPSLWNKAFVDAVSKWRFLDRTYLYIDSTGIPDITISMGNLSNGVIAQASWPSNRKPGPIITINNSFANRYTASQKLLVAVHEIGHCIGLRHTNWRANGESTGIGIPGTPNSGSNPDPASIMNWDIMLQGKERSWNGFSSYDQVAIRTIYPSPLIIGPTDVKLGDRLTYKFDIAISEPFSVLWSCLNGKEDKWGNPSINGNSLSFTTTHTGQYPVGAALMFNGISVASNEIFIYVTR